MMKTFSQLLPALPLALLLSSCSDRGPVVIEDVRDLVGEDQVIVIEEDPEKRFRVRSGPDLPFVWATPEGWKVEFGRAMRDLSFTFGENGEGECYLSRLPGSGGGLTANVNRWRGQMGLEPISDEEAAELPQRSLFGAPASLIDLTGDFSGMGGGDTKEDYRMLGLILSHEVGALFVKMTGPAELVTANEAKFQQFCESLRPR